MAKRVPVGLVPREQEIRPREGDGTFQISTPAAPSSGLSGGELAAGVALGGLLGGDVGGLLRGAGEYYLGQQGIEGAYQTGLAGQQLSQELAEEAAQRAQFRPFTVTTGLGATTTTPEGGISVGLSPEQQALQEQLLGQAQGLFGQVGVSPAEAQAELFEQIRATQRPEEERQRLAMEERLLSQGRLGLQSAAYGGASPELLAMETARQEAMARANLGARQQALAEQQQAASLGGGLLTAGYLPQQQALAALGAGTQVAGLADIGRRTGAQLFGQLGGRGVESYLQGADLANRLQLQQQEALMGSLLGSQPTLQEQLLAQYVGMTPQQISSLGSGGLLSSLGFGDAPTPDLIKSIGDMLGFGGGDREEFDLGDYSQVLDTDYSTTA